MSNTVAGGVEQVEAPISEKVVCWKLPDMQVSVEGEGDQLAASEIGFIDGRFGISGKAREF